MPNNKKVLVISHKFLTQPDDDLVQYLNSMGREDVMHITHSFSDAPDRVSRCRWYKNGTLWKEYLTKDYSRLPEIYIYIRELLFTVSSVFKTKLYWDTVIGADGLCVFYGLVLKFFRKVRKVNYWAMDFVPNNRFRSKLKNYIYHCVNKFGYRNADEMWDLSPRMADAREKFLGIDRKMYKFHRVVPYGVWVDKIRIYTYDECEKSTMVFLGHLIEKQGVQVVLGAIPELIKKIADFKFKIIGTGIYETELKHITVELGIEKHVQFLGKIEPKDYENEIAKSCVAIAPYIEKLDKWTKYADPGKVKTYLACGVPVLLTDVPWNAKEIAELNAGLIVDENIESIAKAAIYLFDASINQNYRTNARLYSTKYDYNRILKELSI